jgi:hypothetical protein
MTRNSGGLRWQRFTARSLCCALLWIVCRARADEAIAIGSNRQLFVDDYLLGQMKGAELRLHEPKSAGTAFTFDQPWEGSFSGYITVLPDGDQQLAYYRGDPGGGKDGNDLEVTCLARSRDGIHWEKPNLGLFEVGGTRNNNVVLAHQTPFSHNFAPFIDERPDVAAGERFKAVAGLAPNGLFGFASSDGVHWQRISDKPIFNDRGWVFDSQNVCFWSAVEHSYVLYYRRVVNGVRTIARADSKDFLHWSSGSLVQFSSHAPTREEQLYTNQTFPWPDAPQIYVSLAARFMKGRSALPAEIRPMTKASWLKDDCSDTVLLTTRDGKHFSRCFPEALVRPGPDPASWTSRGNYAARGVLTSGKTEMSIYVERHYGLSSAFLERLTLRTDGLASVHSGYADSEVVTKPFTFQGDELELNYSTSAAGHVLVQIENTSGQPITRFAASDCTPLIGDAISQIVHWQGGKLSAIENQPVRLHLFMSDADVYSLRFLME